MKTKLSLYVTHAKAWGPEGYLDRCDFCGREIEGKDNDSLEDAVRRHFTLLHITDLRAKADSLKVLAAELEASK